MADIDIKHLRTTELKSFSFQDSLNVVSQIEEAILLDFDAVNTTEEFGEYFSYVNIISTRLNENEFKKISKAQHLSLETRLNNIRFNLSVLLRVNNLAEQQWRDNRQKLYNFRINVEKELDSTREQIITKVDNEKEEVFRKLSLLRTNLNNKGYDEITHLSMGMSDDYLIALKCGATFVRLGRILFS